MKHTGISPNGFLGKCGSFIPFTAFFLVMIGEKWAVSDDESGGLTISPCKSGKFLNSS